MDIIKFSFNLGFMLLDHYWTNHIMNYAAIPILNMLFSIFAANSLLQLVDQIDASLIIYSQYFLKIKIQIVIVLIKLFLEIGIG